MSDANMVVSVSGAYTKWYWVAYGLWSVILLPLFGVGILVFLIALWHKKAVVNRTRATLPQNREVIKFDRGRWFVLDDDAIPIRSIDNVKIDRSVFGKIFGWVNFSIETRSENYVIRFAEAEVAEKFRDHFIGNG